MSTRAAAAAFLLLASTTTVFAEEHVEVGANFMVASDDAAGHGTGYPGGALAMESWFGQIAFGAEVGGQDWEWDGGMKWAGANVRVALYDGSKCSTKCAGIRPWFDVGMAHEWWTFEQPDLMRTERARNVKHIGFGVDIVARRGLIAGATMFLRMQHGDAVEPINGFYREATSPPEKNLAFGIGVMFGGN